MSPFIDIHTHNPNGRNIELFTAGVHPWNAAETCVESLLPLDKRVQAIGETGLDGVCGVDHEVQLSALRAQLRLAVEQSLPVVLHCVRRFEALMEELSKCEPRAVIFHGFVGSAEQAARAVGRGYYLSFGVRSLRSPKTVEALRSTPLERVFVETDDDPTPLEEVYARVTEARGITIEELREKIAENYHGIFK